MTIKATQHVANLPSNDAVFTALVNENSSASTPINDIGINKLCVACWTNERGEYAWYIGYVKKKVKDDVYSIAHLSHELASSNRIWRYPAHEDIHNAVQKQILNVSVQRSWNLFINNGLCF